MKVSLIIPTFNRADLLELCLSSVVGKCNYNLEVVVVNDGLEDRTEDVCDKFNNLELLECRYYFIGHRNSKEVKSRVPGFAINYGVKRSQGDVIVLTCPEIYHLNDGINEIIKLSLNGRFLTIPESMYFDDVGLLTKHLIDKTYISPIDAVASLTSGCVGYEAAQMPYLMGMKREEFIAIRGYDEDFLGYAGDDNDLVNRLLSQGCKHARVNAKIIHLYHGKRCDAQLHPENEAWAYNWELFNKRKGKNVRNIDREWGNG